MSHFERFDHMKSHVHGATLCSSSAIFGKSPLLRKEIGQSALTFSPASNCLCHMRLEKRARTGRSMRACFEPAKP
jgi:hypothetical protein